MKNTFIIAIPVGYTDAREVCEDIQHNTFKDFTELRDVLNSKLGVNEDDDNQPTFYNLNEFMNECNDQYFNFDGTFISYVKIENL